MTVTQIRNPSARAASITSGSAQRGGGGQVSDSGFRNSLRSCGTGRRCAAAREWHGRQHWTGGWDGVRRKSACWCGCGNPDPRVLESYRLASSHSMWRAMVRSSATFAAVNPWADSPDHPRQHRTPDPMAPKSPSSRANRSWRGGVRRRYRRPDPPRPAREPARQRTGEALSGSCRPGRLSQHYQDCPGQALCEPVPRHGSLPILTA